MSFQRFTLHLYIGTYLPLLLAWYFMIFIPSHYSFGLEITIQKSSNFVNVIVRDPFVLLFRTLLKNLAFWNSEM